MDKYKNIKPSGGNTGKPLNVDRRLRLIKGYINLRDKYILDCGCGSGDYVLEFLKYSPNVFGIEYDEDKVRSFKLLNSSPEKVMVGDGEHLTFQNDKFDLVLLNEVLEHVSDEEKILKEIYRVLKPGGVLALFSPNRLYPLETHGVRIKKTSAKVACFCPFIPYIPLALGNRIFEYKARNYFPWEISHKIKQRGFTIRAHTFSWQTFENISGASSRTFITISPFLRKISFFLEKVPVIRMFGISQVIISEKPPCRKEI